MTYTYLPTFIFRTPYLSVNTADIDFYRHRYFQEAIYTASPELYESLMRSKDNLSEELRLSLLKYFLRMKYRCTPFGLFSGCGVGYLGSKSVIEINSSDFYSSTRLDMMYTCELTEAIGESEQTQQNINFYLNNSLYRIGDTYRFIEYKYVEGLRKYYLSEIPGNKVLDKIVKAIDKGMKRSEVAELVISCGINEEEANEYVYELIKNQVIVNQLTPSVTGEKDILQKLISDIKWNMGETSPFLSSLEAIQAMLRKIDSKPPGRDVSLYDEIIGEVSKLKITFNKKYLLQCDLSVTATGTLKEDVFDATLEGFKALIKFSGKSENADLKHFKADFVRRYETSEVLLSHVLDPEAGIGFGKFKAGNASVNRFTEGIEVINYNANDQPEDNTLFQNLLIRKYLNYIKNDSPEIVFTEEEINKLPAPSFQLPDTMAAIVEVINAGNYGEPLVKIGGVSGSSAGNLLGRFCHNYDKIHDTVKEIIRFEDTMLPENYLLAEIVHLSESRMGNILYRPSFRKYEIPYLSASSVTRDYQLPLSDLYISVRQNKILLRSKKMNKYILPRLTTAHNYTSRTLPMYNFLCAVQNDNIQNAVFFMWGPFFKDHKFLPRVRYRNAILAPAQWFMTYNEDLQPFLKQHTSAIDAVAAWRQENNIPAKIFIAEHDNKLLVDLEDPAQAKLFLAETRNKTVRLQEYISQETDPLIVNGAAPHANQIIVTFTKIPS